MIFVIARVQGLVVVTITPEGPVPQAYSIQNPEYINSEHIMGAGPPTLTV